MNNILSKYINYLENDKVAFKYYVLTFIAILLLRSLAEAIFTVDMVHKGIKYFTVISKQYKLIVHFLFFYTCLFLSFTLIINAITKKGLEKVARFVLGSSWIILLPLAEFIYYNVLTNIEFHITYLTPELHSDLIKRFFTFGGSMVATEGALAGLSPFMRIEVFIVLLFSFFYAINSNIKKRYSFAMVFILYSVIFFYALPPFLFKALSKIPGIWLKTDNITMSRFYLILIFLQLFPLLYFFNKKILKVMLMDIRPFRVLFFTFMFFLGAIIGYSTLPATRAIETGWSDIVLKIILVTISIFCAALFSIFSNNIVDLPIDKICNKNRPLIKHKDILSGSVCNKVMKFTLLLSIIFSLAAGIDILFYISSVILVYFIYSVPPFRLKKIPILSKFLISLNLFILYLSGYGLINKNLHSIPPVFLILILGGGTLILNFIDIKDYSGDKANKIYTIPVLLGLRKSKLLIGSFFIICSLFLAYFYKYYRISLIFLVLGLIKFYFINRKKYIETPIFIFSFLSWGLFLHLYLISGAN